MDWERRNSDKEEIPGSRRSMHRLYSDLRQALKGEHLSAPGFQEKRPCLKFVATNTVPGSEKQASCTD